MIDLSKYAQSLNNKSVAVFGLGLSGLASVKALQNADIKVTAWDDKEENRQKAKDSGAAIEDLTSIDLSSYDFLLLAPGVPYTYNPHAVVLNAQKYDLEIIGDLELLHRSGHAIKTIGITGTNGKSTTTALMTHVLNQCGSNAVMGGNIGKAVLELDLTDNIDVLVLEISSYQMDLCPTFRPDISLLLNITPDHLDRHGSMEAYVAAKAAIVEGEGTAIVSVDNDFTLRVFDKACCGTNRKVIPIAIHGNIPEGFYIDQDKLIRNKSDENIEVDDLSGFKTLRGLHNQQNMAFVYVVAKELGLDDKKIFNAFTTYPGLPHRQYLVAEKNNVLYINDSKATNAEAAAKALSSYDHIFWIIGGLPKTGGLQGLEIFKDKIIKSYVIGEAKESFALWLNGHDFNFELFDNLDEATEAAHKDAISRHDNDAVVLLSPACASWDQFTSFEKRGEAFSNKVLELING